MSDWAFAWAVRTGSAPGKTECQDFALFEELKLSTGEPVAVAVIADGAGSAREAAEGAELACKAFLRAASRLVGRRKSLQGVGKKQAQSLVEHVHKIMKLHAETVGVRVAELSCTLVGVLATAEGAVVVQVGDGATVVWRGDDYEVPLWPDHGEYVNETVFVTDPLCLERFQVGRVKGPLDGFAMFSDGMQFLVLDYKAMEPHVPFFQSVFKAMSKQEAGKSEMVSQWLYEKVLGSQTVTTKTDDDLSLVVAVHRGGRDV